jgi:hypothetical protein
VRGSVPFSGVGVGQDFDVWHHRYTVEQRWLVEMDVSK